MQIKWKRNFLSKPVFQFVWITHYFSTFNYKAVTVIWLFAGVAVPPWVGYNEEETIQQQILALSAVSFSLYETFLCPGIMLKLQRYSFLLLLHLLTGQKEFSARSSCWGAISLWLWANVSCRHGDVGGRWAPSEDALPSGPQTVSVFWQTHNTLSGPFSSCASLHRSGFLKNKMFSIYSELTVPLWRFFQSERRSLLEELLLPRVLNKTVRSAHSSRSTTGRWAEERGKNWLQLWGGPTKG